MGILIDSKLTFNQHIDKIIKVAYIKSHHILRVVKTRNIFVFTKIYKVYVRPQLEYATEVWNPHLKNQIDRIEKVQKFFTKIMFKRCGYIYMP